MSNWRNNKRMKTSGNYEWLTLNNKISEKRQICDKYG